MIFFFLQGGKRVINESVKSNLLRAAYHANTCRKIRISLPLRNFSVSPKEWDGRLTRRLRKQKIQVGAFSTLRSLLRTSPVDL
jgi:hypothetical protein